MGSHAQYEFDGRVETLQTLPDGAIFKEIDQMGLAVHSHSINPNLRYIHRHWLPVGAMVPGSSQEECRNIARQDLASYVDEYFIEHGEVLYAVEGWNEVLNWNLSAEMLRRYLMQAEAYAYVWETEYRNRYATLQDVTIILGNVSVGNNIPDGLVHIANRYGVPVGYHPYIHFLNGQRAGWDWKYLSGRWNTQWVEQWGGDLTFDLVFTEMSLVGPTDDGQGLDPLDGWHHPETCGGDINCYERAIIDWIGDVKKTQAWQGGHIIGDFALFTSNDPRQGWESYQTVGQDSVRMAQISRDHWGTSAPSPPAGDKVFVMDRNFWARQHADWGRQYRVLQTGERLPLVGETTGGSFAGSNLWRIVLIEAAVHDAGGHVEGGRAVTAESDAFTFSAWPTDYKYVTQSYGARPDYYSRWGLDGHEGVDVRAPEGSGVYAVADGTVVEVDDAGNYGKHIMIRHPEGYRTLYAHLSQIDVVLNQVVSAGDKIGEAGSTGNSDGAHLHLSLYEGDRRIDPSPYLAPYEPDGYL